jgi:hypothetical protein
MKATIVDLRYRMKDVLKALERNEDVAVYYHGKLKAVMTPPRARKPARVTDHPFFGMCPHGPPVEQVMDELRGGRYRDL